ncbi:uncharacterized protein LOC132720891 [Ruditapes philippinarum]|uniref:uncharacterized protein LOC132720891 n=1 Tax=Ruditapes philippinarum TaxID=129788 RepID=UPI00295A9923|nr:uncharacterized protein LOC132720891 [Ruditapes philippinarum]
MPNSTSNSDHQHGHIDRQVQAAGTIQQAKSNNNKPTASTTDILQGVENLLNVSLAPSTLETYKRSWTLFQTFSNSYFEAPLSLPISVSVIALFVGFLHQKAMSSKSICTYLSGISYVHKLSGEYDPTKHFLISTLIKGTQRLSPSYDLRLPITTTILDKLLAALKITSQSYFHEKLFSAMFFFAFNAFARCSEITKCKPSTEPFILKLSDMNFISEAGQSFVSVTYRFYKHNSGKPHTITFSHGHAKTSAITAMHDYIALRGQSPGPLFSLPSGQPVPRKLFDKQLKSTLSFCGINSDRYKSHSFRIGKATDCAQRGYSDAKIRFLGRWNSNAFRKYIRVTEC